MARKDPAIIVSLALLFLAPDHVQANPESPPRPGPQAAAEALASATKDALVARSAWEEEQVMEFVMAHSPLIRAYRDLTNEFIPASNKRRLMENTELFTGFSVGGTEFRNEPLTVLAGARISIPLASPKERREFAEKRMQEAAKIEAVREQLVADMAELRQYEADLAALQIRYEYLKDRSTWAEERVSQGYDTADNLWDIAQKLTTERAGEVRLNAQIRSKCRQIARYAGTEWPALLAYMEGKADLDAPRVASHFEPPPVE